MKTHISLLPSLPHFTQFAHDVRLDGIRMNNANFTKADLRQEFAILSEVQPTVPIWFDVKGRQPRVIEVVRHNDHLEILLNHPIAADVDAKPMVVFKGGDDRQGRLIGLKEDGWRILVSNPRYIVRPGESLHLPEDPSFDILGEMITEIEKRKIEMACEAGITRFYLSFVWNQTDADELRKITGQETEIRMKIEDYRGLDFVKNRFQKKPQDTLVLARGDFCVAVEDPIEVLKAHRLVTEKDPQACIASRMLLSLVDGGIPVCTDLAELAWLHDIGCRNLLLCDSLCQTRKGIDAALQLVETFTNQYSK